MASSSVFNSLLPPSSSKMARKVISTMMVVASAFPGRSLILFADADQRGHNNHAANKKKNAAVAGRTAALAGELGPNIHALLGVTGDQIKQMNGRVGGNPDFLELLSKPGLLQKLMDIQKDPKKMVESLKDPDIMEFQSKVVGLLQKPTLNETEM